MRRLRFLLVALAIAALAGCTQPGGGSSPAPSVPAPTAGTPSPTSAPPGYGDEY